MPFYLFVQHPGKRVLILIGVFGYYHNIYVFLSFCKSVADFRALQVSFPLEGKSMICSLFIFLLLIYAAKLYRHIYVGQECEKPHLTDIFMLTKKTPPAFLSPAPRCRCIYVGGRVLLPGYLMSFREVMFLHQQKNSSCEVGYANITMPG